MAKAMENVLAASLAGPATRVEIRQGDALSRGLEVLFAFFQDLSKSRQQREQLALYDIEYLRELKKISFSRRSLSCVEDVFALIHSQRAAATDEAAKPKDPVRVNSAKIAAAAKKIKRAAQRAAQEKAQATRSARAEERRWKQEHLAAHDAKRRSLIGQLGGQAKKHKTEISELRAELRELQARNERLVLSLI